jgi:hypothetical protein
MAYGVRTPIVDGNIHRLFTRLLAVHAPQTAPSTIKFLWAAAEELVEQLPKGEGKKGIAGDWNQVRHETGLNLRCSNPPGVDGARKSGVQTRRSNLFGVSFSDTL